MNQMTFTIDQVRAMPRPASFWDELGRCAARRTAHTVTVDVDGPCYKQLQAEYESPAPTLQALSQIRSDSATLTSAPATPAPPVHPGADKLAALTATGCRRCGGRAIRR